MNLQAVQLFFLIASFALSSVDSLQGPLQCVKNPVMPECIEFIRDPQPDTFSKIPLPPFSDETYWDKYKLVDGVDIPESEEGAFKIEEEKIYRYFEGSDISGIEKTYLETTFRSFEWPGTTTLRTDYDSEIHKTTQPLQVYVSKNFYDGRTMVPLQYYDKGTQTVKLTYPCNLYEGLNINAITFRRNPSAPEDESNPIYMSFGDLSFTKTYVHPLLVESELLNKMVEDNSDPECQSMEDSWFVPKGSMINVVYSMAFTNDRLILGMHCGILIIRGIDTSSLHLGFAKLLPTHNDLYHHHESHLHEYYDMLMRPVDSVRQEFLPIALLSSTACCSDNTRCNKDKVLTVASSYPLVDLSGKLSGIHHVYISTDLGASFRKKVVAENEYTTINLIRNLYLDKAKHDNDNSIREPFWITEEIAKAKAQEKWLDSDAVVNYILGKEDKKKDPLITRDSCVQISQLAVVPEKDSFFALCRMTNDDPAVDDKTLPDPKNENDIILRTYGVFEFDIVMASPVITPRRVTQRRVSCVLKPIVSVGKKLSYYEPDLIRTPFSFNLFILGCYSAVFYSTNGGRNFWNVVFYFQDEQGKVYRHHQHPEIEYPLLATSPGGETVTLAFSNKYAYGLMSYGSEFRMIVGTVAETNGRLVDKGDIDSTTGNCKNTALVAPNCTNLKPHCEKRNETFDLDKHECAPFWRTIILFSSPIKFIPFFSNNFALNIIGSLKADKNNPLSKSYEGRDGVRFMLFPLQVNRDIRPFFIENQLIKPEDKWKAFSKCATYSFSYDPKLLNLDIGESGTIVVRVEDKSAYVPIGVYTSLRRLLSVDVKRSNRSVGTKNEVRKYDWDVTLQAIGIPRGRLGSSSDAFFGDSYKRYAEESSHVIVSSVPYARCHTQPIGSVFVNLGCGKKVLVAHEDYHRPHCKKYFESHQFTLEPGEYDKDMVDYWLKTAPQYYQRDEDTGIVQVVYPYAMFGCPMRPYRLDDYEPDLRVIDLNEIWNISDTEKGEPFNRAYVLIEIHGRKKYSYKKTVKEAGCVRPPQTLKNQIKLWRQRLNVIKHGFTKYSDFDIDSAHHPENIWNHVNYRPCDILEDFKGEVNEAILNNKYEIMKHGSGNMLVFDKTDHHELYVFLAVEVEPSRSFCRFSRLFTVSLRKNLESSDLHSFLTFIGFFLLCLLAVLLAFFFFRYKVRREYRENALMVRLEKAAWQVLLHYETLVGSIKGAEQSGSTDSVKPKKRPSAPTLKVRSVLARGSIASRKTPRMSVASLRRGIKPGN